MSIDRSLKTAGSLVRHRNVLTRAERLKKLQDVDRWEEGKSVFGLPKVSNRNVRVGKKEKKKEEAAAAEGAPAATPAAGGTAPAAGGKAPAAAGKAPAAAAKAPAAAKPAGKEAKK